jgi:hypothetical protein
MEGDSLEEILGAQDEEDRREIAAEARAPSLSLLRVLAGAA